MDKKEIIRLLNYDLENEHGAIIQYLTHAYAMGEGELACEIEAIAREEMRHFDWLAETITELGGSVSVNRGKMRLNGKSVSEWMQDDVALEQDAIEPYEEQIKLINDKHIKRLLRRILSDEKAHKDKFKHFISKAKEENLTDIRRVREDEEAKFLNWGIEHEYTVILQYLLHSYQSKDEKVREQLQDQAINEMQHMGWLAEELAGGHGFPKMEYSKVEDAKSIRSKIKKDIEVEKLVAKEYTRGAKEVIKDKKLKNLIIRIRDNENYHVEVFSDLLDRVKK